MVDRVSYDGYDYDMFVKLCTCVPEPSQLLHHALHAAMPKHVRRTYCGPGGGHPPSETALYLRLNAIYTQNAAWLLMF